MPVIRDTDRAEQRVEHLDRRKLHRHTIALNYKCREWDEPRALDVTSKECVLRRADVQNHGGWPHGHVVRRLGRNEYVGSARMLGCIRFGNYKDQYSIKLIANN